MEEVVNLADGNRLRTCADVHAVFQHLHLQALDNGLGAVGGWKDTAVVLHFELDPIFLKEIHDIVVVKLEKKTLYRNRPFPGIPASRSSSVPLFVTLQRPPPVPDGFTFAQTLVFFEVEGLLAVEAGRNRDHHACWPCSDNNGIYCIHAFIVPQNANFGVGLLFVEKCMSLLSGPPPKFDRDRLMW